MGVYSPRPGGFGECDLWVTRRANKHEPWGKTVNLGPIVNTANDESTPSISSDGSMLYFSSMIRGAGWNYMDLWQVEILAVVDFNGDGIFDCADMCIMVDNWGTDDPLCDIGPMPWGDGIVDVQDLIVLAEHLIKGCRLVAHWALDETEGTVAHDSVGDNDCSLHGEPVWHPVGGKIGGALQFDGIDDVAELGKFDVVGGITLAAWIKADDFEIDDARIISKAKEWGGVHHQ